LASIAAIDRTFRDGDLRTRMARHHTDPEVVFRNWADVWLDPAFREWDITAALPAITCPVLAVQGDDDEYGSAAHVEAVRDLASGPVELLMLRCGHAPHLELPDPVADAITRFVRELPAPGSAQPSR
jgi:pimeloyl-ACP methyl ester carboxylesterase